MPQNFGALKSYNDIATDMSLLHRRIYMAI